MAKKPQIPHVPDTVITIIVPGAPALVRDCKIAVSKGNISKIAVFQMKDTGDIADAIHKHAADLANLESVKIDESKLIDLAKTEYKEKPQPTPFSQTLYDKLKSDSKQVEGNRYALVGASPSTAAVYAGVIANPYLIGASSNKPVLLFDLIDPPQQMEIAKGKPAKVAPMPEKIEANAPVQQALFG